jgi:hypothetical protein
MRNKAHKAALISKAVRYILREPASPKIISKKTSKLLIGSSFADSINARLRLPGLTV